MIRRTSPDTAIGPEIFMLPGDPDKAMLQMMKIIEKLKEVYERETQALQASNMRAFSELQDEKLSTARLYQTGAQEIILRKEEMRAINPDLKQKLRAMQEEFSALSQKNLEALARMQRNVTRVGQTIQRAAKEVATQERGYSYNPDGQLHDDNKKAVSMGVTETA